MLPLPRELSTREASASLPRPRGRHAAQKPKMERLYSTCCGIDVHRRGVTACCRLAHSRGCCRNRRRGTVLESAFTPGLCTRPAKGKVVHRPLLCVAFLRPQTAGGVEPVCRCARTHVEPLSAPGQTLQAMLAGTPRPRIARTSAWWGRKGFALVTRMPHLSVRGRSRARGLHAAPKARSLAGSPFRMMMSICPQNDRLRAPGGARQIPLLV